MDGTNIKVIVRVRPLLPREAENAGCLVVMDGQNTTLTVPKDSPFHSRSKVFGNDKPEFKQYSFDESVWSFDKNKHYVDNQGFYRRTGADILDHFFQGFNVCLLAYGQTGSGKTYTMMGQQEDLGIIPLMIRDILHHKQRLIGERINCELKLSYVEIYNEQVKDLLGEDGKKCRIREHPVTGPYVENVQEFRLTNFNDFSQCLHRGNSNRATAATSMNDKSSRSHAIITLTLKQTKFVSNKESIGDPEEEMVSSIRLVDLAGSERLSKTKVYGQQERMKEGTLINKSLTVLGRCINLLAKNNGDVIPYRDSILTYILKENLGGNSKTFMIFCISPIDFEETYQTLNYADQVKKIKTSAKANKTKLATVPVDWEELKALDQSVIAKLKREIEELTEKLNDVKVDSKSIQLINYLEKESNKLKFENEFLKQKLVDKNREIAELRNHNDYITNEMVVQHQNQVYLKQLLINDYNGQLKYHQADIRSSLDDFDPKNIF